MTTTMQVPVDDVTWRALRTGFWVARRDGRHLGTLERGRRWIASDADGEPIGAFRTFPQAQAAVAEPAAHRAVVHEPVAVAPALVAVVVAAVGIASASAWALTALVA